MLDRITIHPEICMGQPTIRGMRITVAFVLKLLVTWRLDAPRMKKIISSNDSRKKVA